MSLLVILLLLGLSTWQVTETLHHGSIFSRLREWAAEVDRESAGVRRWLLTPVRALGCPFCLSHWAALLLLGPALLALYASGGWSAAGLAPLLWLSGVRASGLLNDLLHRWNRTPKDENPRLSDATPEQLEQRLIERLGDYQPVEHSPDGERAPTTDRR